MTYPGIIEQRKRDEAAKQIRLWRGIIYSQRRDPRYDVHTEIRINNGIIAIRAYRYALKLFGDANAGG